MVCQWCVGGCRCVSGMCQWCVAGVRSCPQQQQLSRCSVACMLLWWHCRIPEQTAEQHQAGWVSNTMPHMLCRAVPCPAVPCQVLIDWEVVRAALKLPADCGQDAKLRLAVQLANSSLAEAQLGEQRQALQQQLDAQQRRLGVLAAGLEALWMNGSSSSKVGPGSSSGNATTNSSALSQELLLVQADVERLHDALHAAVAGHEAANEQLKLAELRMHNCQPTGTNSAAAAAAAGLAGAAQGRGLLSSLLGGFTAARGTGAAGASGAAGEAGAVGIGGGSQVRHHHGLVANPLSHMRGVLSAVARFDFTTAGAEVSAMLGQLVPDMGEEQQAAAEDAQQEQQQGSLWQGLDGGAAGRPHVADESCGLTTAGARGSLQGAEQQRPFGPLEQCPSNNTCSAEQDLRGSSLGSTQTSSAVAVTGAKQQGGAKSSGSGSSNGGGGSRSSTSSTSLVRVARGAAYPLITLLRHVSSVLVAGLGSTTAVALGTGLGVLRLGECGAATARLLQPRSGCGRTLGQQESAAVAHDAATAAPALLLTPPPRPLARCCHRSWRGQVSGPAGRVCVCAVHSPGPGHRPGGATGQAAANLRGGCGSEAPAGTAAASSCCAARKEGGAVGGLAGAPLVQSAPAAPGLCGRWCGTRNVARKALCMHTCDAWPPIPCGQHSPLSARILALAPLQTV